MMQPLRIPGPRNLASTFSLCPADRSCHSDLGQEVKGEGVLPKGGAWGQDIRLKPGLQGAPGAGLPRLPPPRNMRSTHLISPPTLL